MENKKIDENVVKCKGLRVDVKYPLVTRKEDRDKAIDKALKKFKRKIKDSGLMVEIQDRQFFSKPSKLKREKRIKSLLRNQYITKVNNS